MKRSQKIWRIWSVLFLGTLCRNAQAAEVNDGQIFPIKIEVSLPSKKVAISEEMQVNIHVLNVGNSAQTIGTEVCGMHGVNSWIVNDQSLRIYGGGFCRQNLIPPQKVILKPGESYEQVSTVSFKYAKPGQLSFRIGLEPNGLTLGRSQVLEVEDNNQRPRN